MWQDHARALDHRLQPPRAATIRFRGETLVGRSAEQIVRSGVGLVQQGQRIFPSLTVREQLAIAERRSAGTEWTVGRVLEVFGAPRPADAQGNRLRPRLPMPWPTPWDRPARRSRHCRSCWNRCSPRRGAMPPDN